MRRFVRRFNLSYVIAFAFILFALSVFLITKPTLSAAGDLNIAWKYNRRCDGRICGAASAERDTVAIWAE